MLTAIVTLAVCTLWCGVLAVVQTPEPVPVRTRSHRGDLRG